MIVNNPYELSFFCSLGYRVLESQKKEDRMNDMFLFLKEDKAEIDAFWLKRKDFISFVSDNHFDVTKGRDVIDSLNACDTYDLFDYGMKRRTY